MKKKLFAFAFVLAVLLTLCVVVVANEAEAKDITISYVNEYNSSSATTSLDKNAYENGKQTVKAGEKFTLPTTSSHSYSGKEGYQLRWYTEDGRSFKGGDEVSFTEDTRLFRVAAKEVWDIDALYTAMSSESYSAILMCDIDGGNSYISVWSENFAILDLGGHTLKISKNGTVMGGQRSGKTIIGEGTFKVTNPDGKVGSYAVFECKGHGHNGDKNITLIGRDVTVDAPNFYLCTDGEGTGKSYYPWVKVYGTINVYYILARWGSGNPVSRIDFYETCNVTLTAPYMNVDYKKPTDTTVYNKQAFAITIYGGTFNLPAEAANVDYWTTDYNATDGTLTLNNKELIKVEGGTFILPDGAKPAIDDYLKETYVIATSTSMSNLLNNKETTSYINYIIRDAYKIVYKTNGTAIVTDNIGTGIGGTYYYTVVKTSDNSAVDYINYYTNSEKTALADVIKAKAGNTGLLYSFASTTHNVKLQLEDSKYIVVPAECEHSFVTTVVNASCQTEGSITSVCKNCGHTVVEITEPKTAHAYELKGTTSEATQTALGSKSYACSACGKTEERPYSLDPSNLEVKVTIRNDDDTYEEITVLASDVFEFSTNGADDALVYTLSAIKKFGNYSIRNIYGITIPKGILFVRITTQNNEKYKNVDYGVEELKIADGATVTIGNIGNLRRLKTIKVGSANVVFSKGCCYYNPNNEKRGNLLATLDVSAPNSNIVFETSAFNDRKTITSLKLGENSTYDFKGYSFYKNYITDISFPANAKITLGTQAFYDSRTENIIIPDNADITLAGTQIFHSSTTKYLYIGKNTVLSSAHFGAMKYLEKIVIMDGVTISGYFENLFSDAGSADFTTPLHVYNHSTEFKNLAKQTFNNCDGIFYYTVADIGTRGDIFNNCADVNDADGNFLYKKWTVILGIPHPVKAHTIDATCEEVGYETWIAVDCPCGTHLTEEVIAKTYESVYKLSTQTPVSEKAYAVSIIDALGHDKLGEKTNIVYASYLEKGSVSYICTRCKNEHTVENDADALFIFNGYSMPEDGDYAITVGYSVNIEAVQQYEAITGKSLEYGVVCALAEKLNGKAPLDESLEGVPVIKASIDKKFASFDFILSGFSAEQLNLELVMSAYVIEGDNVVYLQETKVEIPESISINKYITDNTPTVLEE